MTLLAAGLIFLVTFVVVSGRSIPGLNLDRTGAVLLGAVGMVMVGALTPEQAWKSIHVGTLGLLFGMMVITVHLEEAGFFEWAAWQVLRHARAPRKLLLLTLWTAGALSALLVNDTVCLMLTPLVIRVWRGAGLPLLPGLMALSMGANLGSALTLTGNPQNMIIGQLSGLPFTRFSWMALPAVCLGLLSAGALLEGIYRNELRPGQAVTQVQAPTVQAPLLVRSVGCLIGVVMGFLLGFDLAWTALAGAAVLLPLAGLPPRTVLEKVDFSLLVFFSGLFIVMDGLGKAGASVLLADWSAPLIEASGPLGLVHLAWLSVVGSQVTSNVPWVLLVGPLIPKLSDAEGAWIMLALSSTFAGNLTLLGSVANVIVIEGARDDVQVGFWGWLRVGLPVTLMTLGLGGAALVVMLQLR